MLAYVLRVLESAHVGAGGALHVTPAHGSAAQTVPEQPNAQVVLVPGWQTPAPAQVEAVVATPPEQVATGHAVVVGAYVHVPPAQVPVLAYVFRVLASTQVEAGGALHVMPAHGSPAQTVPAQPALQLVVAPATQLPAPLQVDAATAVDPEQLPGPQLVPAPAFASAGQVIPAPSHFSATSQVPAAARQTTVAALGLHVPSAAVPPLAALHAWQSVGSPAPQAVLQQTPSTQLPDVHSAFVLQAAPFAFRAGVSEASASPGTAVSAASESARMLVSAASAVPVSLRTAVSAASPPTSGELASGSSTLS